MCQALGYDRLSQVSRDKDSDYERKAILFWSIYVMDRNTSLRLGRLPAIHDDDIDTPMPQADHDKPMAALHLRSWVGCARIQGNISRQLYGPRASLMSVGERARLAEASAAELDSIYKRKIQVGLPSTGVTQH